MSAPRCEVSVYAVGALEPIAPRCNRPAPYYVEASSGPDYHVCHRHAREAIVRFSERVIDVNGEFVEFAIDIPEEVA